MSPFRRGGVQSRHREAAGRAIIRLADKSVGQCWILCRQRGDDNSERLADCLRTACDLECEVVGARTVPTPIRPAEALEVKNEGRSIRTAYPVGKLPESSDQV